MAILTNEDIELIIKANKELFYTKDEMDGKFEGIREDFSKLQTAVSSFAVGTKNNADEIKVANNRASNQEQWIKQAADKIKVEYKP